MSLKHLKKLKEDYEKFVQQDGRQAILDGVKELFTEFPQIKKIGFKSSTPTWNDGSACVFSFDEFAADIDDEKVKKADAVAAEKARAEALAEHEKNLKIWSAENEVLKLKGEKPLPKPKLVEEVEEEDDDDFDCWSYRTKNKKLEKALDAFEKELCSLEDVLEVVFGSNHKVIIKNDEKLTLIELEYGGY